MMLLAALLLLAANTYGQDMYTAPNDADPAFASVSTDHGDDDAVIVRQMAYPIPTYDYVRLELEGKAHTSVRIRVEDAAGDEIYSLFRVVDLDPDYVGRIDMRDQDRAVYHLIVETPSGDEITRMEIEKR